MNKQLVLKRTPKPRFRQLHLTITLLSIERAVVDEYCSSYSCGDENYCLFTVNAQSNRLILNCGRRSSDLLRRREWYNKIWMFIFVPLP